MLFLENSASSRPSQAKINVYSPSFCFSFEVFQRESKILCPKSNQNLRNFQNFSSMLKDRSITSHKGQTPAPSSSHIWPRPLHGAEFLETFFYLVQHQKLTSSMKKKAGPKSTWCLLHKVRQAVLHRACICFVIVPLTQVCNMQRFNPNRPGRNRGNLTVTRQETHKGWNDLNAQKTCFQKSWKGQKID